MQRPLDVGQRHVHDRDVEKEHEGRRADGDQGPPFAVESGHSRSVPSLVFSPRTMWCDRRIGPHHRDRRPHAAVRRLLRRRRRREGGPGRAQRDRQVVLHLGAGGRDRAAAAPPGQRPPARLVRLPAPGARCRAGSGSSRPASRTSSRPGASTSSTTRWARPAAPWPTIRPRRTSSSSPTCRSSSSPTVATRPSRSWPGWPTGSACARSCSSRTSTRSRAASAVGSTSCACSSRSPS